MKRQSIGKQSLIAKCYQEYYKVSFIRRRQS